MNIRKIRVTFSDIMVEEAINYILEEYYNLDPSKQRWDIDYVSGDLMDVKLYVSVFDPDWDESKVEEDFVEVIDD
jgi:hypothetical protein